MKAKFEAFGWQVMTIRNYTGQKRPLIILMKTEMGMGVGYTMNTHKWHGVAPGHEQLEKALEQMEETPGDYLNIQIIISFDRYNPKKSGL